MNKLGQQHVPLFLPTVNVLQERALDKKFNFEIDFQNNNLYTLQELTRCASLLNYINLNGRNLFGNNTKSKVNSVFDAYIRINDPMAIFVDNFEQFFAMYIQSKYGKNNFQLYMKECEKSPVAYPVSVFQEGLCIFMQYNTNELRHYIYNIMTMFYYYTGRDYYEMIRPNISSFARPNDIDEFTTSEQAKKCGKRKATNGTGVCKSREEKLCFLNNRNLNINKPYLQNNQIQNDTLSTGDARFEKCILTGNFGGDQQYSGGVLVGKLQKPIVEFDNSPRLENDNILPPAMVCNKKGITQDTRIFQLSEHLKRSCNFEVNTLGDDSNSRCASDYSSRNRQYERKTFIQTNFSTIWSCDNRRQLVSLSIICSVMNVCIQKITHSLVVSRNKQCSTVARSEGCTKLFNCMNNNPDTISYRNLSENNHFGSEYGVGKQQLKPLLKVQKPTIEVTFNRDLSNRLQTSGLASGGPCNLKFDDLRFST